MAEIRAVLLDLGHTLVDFDVEGGALLTSYREVHEYIDGLGLGSQPVAEDLMPRLILISTVGPPDEHRRNADALRQACLKCS